MGMNLSKGEQIASSVRNTKILPQPIVKQQTEKDRTDQSTRAWARQYPEELREINWFREERGLPVLTPERV